MGFCPSGLLSQWAFVRSPRKYWIKGGAPLIQHKDTMPGTKLELSGREKFCSSWGEVWVLTLCSPICWLFFIIMFYTIKLLPKLKIGRSEQD